jgi:hypothetical protein
LRSIKHLVLRVHILNLKVQTADSNVEHDLHIELSLEIKIYIFLNFFAIFIDGYKITSFGWYKNR